MSRCLQIAMSAAAACLLAGCVSWMLAAEDRKLLCHAAVEEKSGGLQTRPNPFSGLGGPAAGSASGALYGLVAGAAQGAGAGLGVVIFAPAGAALGAACAAAAAAHPTADADFQRILDTADTGVLKQALETALGRERDECRSVRADAAAAARPPASIVSIDKQLIMMGCLTGRQSYEVFVKWHTSAAKSGRVLSEGETICTMMSFRSVDDWFADSPRAKEEIEGTLARVGGKVAEVLLAESTYSRCLLRSKANGEIVEGR